MMVPWSAGKIPVQFWFNSLYIYTVRADQRSLNSANVDC